MDVSYDNVVGVSKMETELSSPNSIQTKKKKKSLQFFSKGTCEYLCPEMQLFVGGCHQTDSCGLV